MMSQDHHRFGPWAPDLDPAERRARLRAMRALALVFARRESEFIAALARAERGNHMELELALCLLDKVPALQMRKMLCTYADLA